MLLGFLNIYKPKGVTSNSLVGLLRRNLKIKQIGFAGTLDPVAQGVLPFAVGKATKLIDYLNNDKSYIATAQFGYVSTTFDLEGEITKTDNAPLVTKIGLENAMLNFKGEIFQKPPTFSAVHVNGKRLYEIARSKPDIDETIIPSRKVFVSDISLISFDEKSQIAKILVSCSKGTYIRSIVSDLGKALNSGAVMTDLLRTSSSGFDISTSIKPELINLENVNEYLIPVENKIDSVVIEVNDFEYEKIKHGNSIFASILTDKTVFIKYKNRVIGFGSVSDSILKVKKVFEVI